MKKPRLKHAALPDGRKVWCVHIHELRGVPEEIPGYWQHGVSVAPSDIVLDVGANVGLFALDAAARGAQVHAFEPMPATFAALQANSRSFEGKEGRIETHNLALGEAPQTAQFTYFPHLSAISTRHSHAIHHNARAVVTRVFDDPSLTPRAGWFRRAPRALRFLCVEACARILFSSRPVSCQIETVSRMLTQLNVERVALLKIDVEGAEWDVLQGIQAADCPRIEQIVAEVHNEDGRLEAVCNLLRERGFTVSHEPVPVAADWDTHMVWARR
ncbi:MAG: FkbM family methyltransferase [Armatimonadetes bacterium]|nr:FkbM family methyltransferase [Armatimonadota bacterium]